MSLLQKAKKLVEELPEGLAKPLAAVPFSLRLGPQYRRFLSRIDCERSVDPERLEVERFVALRSLVQFASENVRFYRDFYREAGFEARSLQKPVDWLSVPVVTKADLQRYSLADRISGHQNGLKVNTGGTSGQPLEFFLERGAFAREWAHMHYLWVAHGYHQRHVKVTFRGKHFNEPFALKYNVVHNEYVVNANRPMDDVVSAVLVLARRERIRWLHGYPSLIAEFAHSLQNAGTEAVAVVRTSLFGVLLGSEFPIPAYRNVIESVLTTNVVSWYGHSEMAVLARETAREVYESFPTYGHAESVSADGAWRLVCTALYNRVHPFIRYDTGDLIAPVSLERGVLAFKVAEGRVGDFILDRAGRRHSLTAVIFGRHHPGFALLKHLQVRQTANGKLTLFVNPVDSNIGEAQLRSGFDFSGLDLEWDLAVIDSPVRTAAGKIKLKI